jgi:hypothetical protein
MKQFTANIPARTIKGQSKVFTYSGRDDEYICDDQGHWKINGESVNEVEVIEDCRKATNWADIKARFFPMDGFHADMGEDWDNTPSHKLDY